MAGGNEICGLCNKPAYQSCSSCNKIYYCSKEHQKKHWKEHKSNCAPFKVQTNESLGRYLVAARHIPEGTTIMRKKPLILGPKTASYPLCLGCHKKLYVMDLHNCSKCSWPLCSKNCETSNLHVQECVVFAQNNFKPEVRFDNDKQAVYSCITPLRCLLLKQKDKSKYDILMSFQSHLEKSINTPLYQLLKRSLVPIFLQKLKLETNEQEILTICSILDTNSFDVRDTKGQINIRGLYSPVNLVAHDCKQNTKHSFHGENFEIVLTSIVPIKINEMITASYTQTLWGTQARRSHLQQAKHFDCVCKRCSDPTEFGTYAASIFCSQCKEFDESENCPKMISTNALDQNADWKCTNCDHVVTAKQMRWGNDALKMEIRGLNKKRPQNFEDFLVKYRNTLHATNCHFLEVKYALSQMYGNMEGFRLSEMSDELIERKIELCNELLNVADTLEPGLSRFRGSLLFDLQAAMAVQAKRNYVNGQITKKTAQDIFAQAINILEESTKILITEPNMKNILEERIVELNKLIEFDF